MEVNTLQRIGKSISTVVSPVVPVAEPESEKPKVAQAIKKATVDVVELSRGSQIKAADNPLIANNRQNIRSGSRVFHDEATNQFVVQIINENNEVIRQVPAEEALKIARRFRELTGLIFDQLI